MMKLLAELRNWTTASFYRSALNVMGGLAAGFLFTLVVRPVGTGTFIAGNINAGGTAGWLLSVTTVADNATTPVTSVAFTIVEDGNDQTFTVSLDANLAKVLVIHARYMGDTVRIYVNGILLNETATAGEPFSASALYFGLGNNANNAITPDAAAGFIACGYVANTSLTSAGITANALEIIKRGDITDAGLDNNVVYTYEYSASQSNNGTPSLLVNKGSAAPNGDLTLQGDDVIVGSAPYFLGSTAAPSGGG